MLKWLNALFCKKSEWICDSFENAPKSLYITLVNSRIEEEFDHLLARGNNHRDVLESPRWNIVTMKESEAETDVVITNEKGHILYYSDYILPFAKKW